jgi:hypothetical protein
MGTTTTTRLQSNVHVRVRRAATRRAGVRSSSNNSSATQRAMGQQGGEGEEKTGLMRGGGEPDPSFSEVPLSGFEPESDPVRTMPFFEYFKTSGQTVRWCRSWLSSRWMRMDERIGWMSGRTDGRMNGRTDG